MIADRHRRARSRSTAGQTARSIAAKALGLATVVACAGSAFAQAGGPKTDEEKAFYAIGTSLATYIRQFEPLSDRELDLVVQGLRDVVDEKVLAVEQQTGGQLVQALVQARQERAVQAESAAAGAFLAAEEKKVGAKKTGSGLVITHLKPGAGPSPAATDTVRVHYHGTLRDGSVFDSSIDKGKPVEFPLNRVIPCWTEGVALMKVGGKARLVCPSSIAYGSRGALPRIPPSAALVFEVELLEIVKK